jgi:AAA family ATP:ADP antiporter
MVKPQSLTAQPGPELLSHQSFPVFRAVDKLPKSRLERLLSIFADVRAGEGATALIMTANIFLLLGAYYLLKPVREALILSESGAEVKSYSAAAQAVLLLGLVPLYGWFATKVTRSRLMAGLTGFFVANLALFWIAGSRGLREGVAFYIWVGIFSVFMISQFWAFANDIYTEAQGKRLFPLIGAGMSLGALVGSAVVAPLVKQAGVGPYSLMLIAAVVLLGYLTLMRVVAARANRTAVAEKAGEDAPPLGIQGGFELILQDRYLFWIAVLIVLLNLVNTVGEYALGKLVVTEAAKAGGDPKAFISQFYGRFYSLVNLSGLVLQALGASRVLRHVGVRGALFILPVLSLLSYSAMAVAPILAVVRWMKVLENSTDYSIMNTVRQALWLPTSREAKYKAKAAIDTFFMRAGDVLQAGIVFLGTTAGAGMRGFGWLNVALTVVWLLAARQIAIEHRKRST